MHRGREGRAIATDWLGHVSWQRIAGVGGLAVIACVAGIVVAEPIAVDVALGALGAAVGGATGWGVFARRALDRLPLELSDAVLLAERNGRVEAHVRVRLGLGRTVRAPRVDAVWHGPAGSHRVEAAVPHQVLCGAWTLIVPEAPGDLEIALAVDEGGREWELRRRYPRDAMRTGRWAPGFDTTGGRVRVDYGAWSAVEASDSH